jgi:hypothetical protein
MWVVMSQGEVRVVILVWDGTSDGMPLRTDRRMSRHSPAGRPV